MGGVPGPRGMKQELGQRNGCREPRGKLNTRKRKRFRERLFKARLGGGERGGAQENKRLGNHDVLVVVAENIGKVSKWTRS